MDSPNPKRCFACRLDKPREDFGSDKSRRDGLNARCRECERTRDRSASQKAWQAANRERLNERMREWRAANPEREREIQKRYTSSEAFKAKARAEYATDPEPMKAYLKEYRLRRWHVVTLSRLRKRSEALGLLCDLTAEDLVIPETCPVLGIPLVMGGNTDNTASVDRIDPKGGYVKGNVAIISMRANRIKNDATISELERVIQYIRSHHERSSSG